MTCYHLIVEETQVPQVQPHKSCPTCQRGPLVAEGLIDPRLGELLRVPEKSPSEGKKTS